MESKCSRYIEVVIAHQICDTGLYITRQSTTRNYRAVQGYEPWVWSRSSWAARCRSRARCPNGKAEVKGARDGENGVPDDPPQEGIQEERKVHDGQGECGLVSAESVTGVLVVAHLNLHSDHGIDRPLEGER